MREPLERQYFDECVRPLLGGDIEYLGELNAAEKYQLLSGAFALLNPIQWPEPFGLVMIEALACGTPVIATRAASVPEIVTDGDTGFLRFDLSALAQALTRAPELDRKRCRETAVTCFSTSRMVAEHVQLYRRLLEGGPEDRGGRLRDDVMAVAAPIVRDRGPRQPVLRRPHVPSSSLPAPVPVESESVL
jgi:glycosyltransferase involved in cell wall biosynthesis